jgi:anti-anti-sigma factor
MIKQKHGAVTVLCPQGALVDAEVEPFKRELVDTRRQSMGRFVVDMSGLPFCDSKGLESLVDESRELARSGQTLRLCGVNETLREVMDLTETANLFEQYQDVNTAVRSFL